MSQIATPEVVELSVADLSHEGSTCCPNPKVCEIVGFSAPGN